MHIDMLQISVTAALLIQSRQGLSAVNTLGMKPMGFGGGSDEGSRLTIDS